MDPPKVQQFVSIPHNNEGMLPLRPCFAIGINVLGKIWTTHKSLGSLGKSFRGKTPRFHTPEFIQGLKVDLDEHIKVTSMFQQAT
jgi:hypothetical protein